LGVKHLLTPLLASTFVVAGCSSGDRSVNIDELRDADAPYYFVGPSFDGYAVSDVLPYRDGTASILYGDCHAGDDQGCAPPLEIQHRLCLGGVTVSIFGDPGRARRAAAALRPLSKAARARPRPVVVLDQGVSC
jgi:hypothetical protein